MPPPVLLRLRGLVQGVGFRPSVYRIANDLRLRGWVRNSADGAEILLAGGPPPDDFLATLRRLLPPPARIDAATVHTPPPPDAPPPPPAAFAILPSPPPDPSAPRTAALLPDLATCPDCLADLFDPANRRYRYPFVNCTRCGPRFSILRRLPYDRPNTSMAAFPLCPDCLREYLDPADRRFHAQPNACPVCGPRLEFRSPASPAPLYREDALAAAEALLRSGRILALKGIGGFHLLCDARDPAAVRRLRLRKRRPARPLAVLFPSLDAVAAQCRLSPPARTALLSPAAPIVLLPLGPAPTLPVADLAPGLVALGAFLPYSPLHHLLLRDLSFPLVATSANPSGEPICTDNEEALARLSAIVDAFLLHDRPILRPLDDSVMTFTLDSRPLYIRRARGLAPYLLPLPPSPTRPTPTLAAGALLKNTIALALPPDARSSAGQSPPPVPSSPPSPPRPQSPQSPLCPPAVPRSTGQPVNRPAALLSPHIGNLTFTPSLHLQSRLATDLLTLRSLPLPPAVATELHPAAPPPPIPAPTLPVQHHHAHLASVMAEHRLPGPALGIALDGTGAGTDSTVWGFEILRLPNPRTYVRLARLLPFPLPGGDLAVRDPRRTALSLLRLASLPPALLPYPFPPAELALLHAQLDARLNAPLASSAGRLFDAASVLLSLTPSNLYEGHAPALLEAAAAPVLDPLLADPASALDGFPSPYPFDLLPPSTPDAPHDIDWRPTLRAFLADPAPVPLRAARFHHTVARMALAPLLALAPPAADSPRDVLLAGGCFQNLRLLALLERLLRHHGYTPRPPLQAPPSDAALSHGQLAAL